MNKILLLLLLLIFAKASHCQIVAELVGGFMEYDYNWGKDSAEINKMLDTFKIDITGLKPKKFFDDKKFSEKLQDNNTYIGYSYFHNEGEKRNYFSYDYFYQRKPLIRKYLYIRTIHYHNGDKSIDILIY